MTCSWFIERSSTCSLAPPGASAPAPLANMAASIYFSRLSERISSIRFGQATVSDASILSILFIDRFRTWRSANLDARAATSALPILWNSSLLISSTFYVYCLPFLGPSPSRSSPSISLSPAEFISRAYSKFVSMSSESATDADRCACLIAGGFNDSKNDSIVGGTKIGLLKWVSVAGLLWKA